MKYLTKLVLVRRKRNVTGSLSFSRQIGFRFTVFNTTGMALLDVYMYDHRYHSVLQVWLCWMFICMATGTILCYMYGFVGCLFV